MEEIKQTLIRLNITPQTRVTATQRDVVLFRMPEDCPVNCGMPRRSAKQDWIEVKNHYGKTKKVRFGCKHCLSEEGLKRKRRLEQYNNYKENLLLEATEKGFILPNHGTAITFFIPVPPSWTKKKKKLNHFKIHHTLPDLDNLLKAMQDALRLKDFSIGHFSGLEKRWVYADTGWIEIILTTGPEPEYRPFRERAAEIREKMYGKSV